jgi:Castor and Pollux, part of voltage-gated ion channel
VRAGLVRVVDTLFTHDPSKEQLHFVAEPNMVGETYGSVRRRVNGAVVLGYKTGPGAARVTKLNPSDDNVIQSGDELLVLAKHNKCTFQLTPVVPGARSCLPCEAVPPLCGSVRKLPLDHAKLQWQPRRALPWTSRGAPHL